MKLEFKLEEPDYLEYQLFASSKSERIKKKKRNGWLFLTFGSILVAIHFYVSGNYSLAIYLLCVAIINALFYPKYFNWRYKKHYKRYIGETYKERFGITATMELNNDSILTKDKTGEGKMNLSEITQVDETPNHFFVKISSGLSLIIPKRELKNIEDIRVRFKELNLTLIDETNWRWK